MITYLEGEIKYIGEVFLEIFCEGIGYKVFCPRHTLGVFSIGERANIFTHLHVRENMLDLYGFKTRDERDFFEILISISGIGPKSGMGIIQAAPLDLLKKAIVSGDMSVLTKVSGIGQKTAQRIIIELKGKLRDVAKGSDGESLREGSDVIDALVGLGYSRSQAQSAFREVPESVVGVENKVKEALKILGK